MKARAISFSPSATMRRWAKEQLEPRVTMRPASCADALLGLATLLAEAALEPGDPATGVQDLLLAGVERVAVGADVGVDLAVRGRASGGKGAAAGASDLGHHVLRVGIGLHDSL